MEDDVVSGATDRDEKLFTCLCGTEKKAEAQVKFNAKVGRGTGD